MICDIQWDHAMPRERWDALLEQCAFSTLTQSYYYAQAMRAVHQQSSRHGLIIIDGQEAGIVQMQEVSLFRRAIHILSVDRGPIWFEGYGDKTHAEAFAKIFDKKFPKRMGRKRRFIPEFRHDAGINIPNEWVKRGDSVNYKTYNIDLSPDIDKIRSNLYQKWRNSLNKAEKEPLSVNIDTKCDDLEQFLVHYIKDRVQKRYGGASRRFLSALARHASLYTDCFILSAYEGGRVVASIIVFKHGKTATYQAGWTSMTGRARGAHHLLLWRAVETLKDYGVTCLDLGGHNAETQGIQKFKEGLGGHEIALIGVYR